VQIGALDSSAILRKVLIIQAANNPLAAREGTVWLSQAALANALGLAVGDSMRVTVHNGDGTTETQTVQAFDAYINDAWYQQGEMFGPRKRQDTQPYVTAFARRGPLDFRKRDPSLPPHLRYRLPYYLLELPDYRALYVQWNFVHDWGDEGFTAFIHRVFASLDAHPDYRLIFDVRYNSGGDGSKVPQVIKQIVKHAQFDQPGHLFVITGRKTFSAAVDFVGQAKAWTSAIFVGEPTGAGLNAYGDPLESETPNLKIPFQVSTSYHQHTNSKDQSGEFAPDIPAVMTAADYFAGGDPPLQSILDGGEVDLLPIPALGAQYESKVARTALEKRTALWSAYGWWQPFSELDMNSAGYARLRAGHALDAVELFKMNADRYPRSANVWDSLGEAQRAGGDIAAAKLSYSRELQLDPGAKAARAALAEMDQTGR